MKITGTRTPTVSDGSCRLDCDSKNMQLNASKLTCWQIAANYYIHINNKSLSL